MLGISQAELARRAKVPQTTVNGLIRGDSRSTPHLLKIAKELKTNAAYLTGESSNPDIKLEDIDLLNSEIELINSYKTLNEFEKKFIKYIIDKLASN